MKQSLLSGVVFFICIWYRTYIQTSNRVNKKLFSQIFIHDTYKVEGGLMVLFFWSCFFRCPLLRKFFCRRPWYHMLPTKNTWPYWNSSSIVSTTL